MMDILMLASGYRSQIEILVDGDDEKIAVKEIKSLFSDRFGEES
jgi:phosphotransferase system HPr-like phosphotransfer protein